jgi:hypothetical protein
MTSLSLPPGYRVYFRQNVSTRSHFIFKDHFSSIIYLPAAIYLLPGIGEIGPGGNRQAGL